MPDESVARDMPQTTAIGLHTDAREMIAAATILLEQEKILFQPVYFLLGHSLELLLKSILLANEIPLSQLKKKYGHDLEKAARKVIEVTDGDISILVTTAFGMIAMLNKEYRAKNFEYRVTGAVRLPDAERVLELNSSLLKLVRPIAFSVYPNR